jgi:hypothetical protein
VSSLTLVANAFTGDGENSGGNRADDVVRVNLADVTSVVVREMALNLRDGGSISVSQSVINTAQQAYYEPMVVQCMHNPMREDEPQQQQSNNDIDQLVETQAIGLVDVNYQHDHGMEVDEVGCRACFHGSRGINNGGL